MEGVQGFRPEEVRLREARIEELAPMAFVNLDAGAPSLADFLGEIPAEIEAAGFRLDELVRSSAATTRSTPTGRSTSTTISRATTSRSRIPGLYRAIDYDRYRWCRAASTSAQYAPLRSGDATAACSARPPLPARRRRGARALLLDLPQPDAQPLRRQPAAQRDRAARPRSHAHHLRVVRAPDLLGEKLERLRESIAFSDEIQREDIELCEAVQRWPALARLRRRSVLGPPRERRAPLPSITS
jgi:choline monooxygenase